MNDTDNQHRRLHSGLWTILLRTVRNSSSFPSSLTTASFSLQLESQCPTQLWTPSQQTGREGGRDYTWNMQNLHKLDRVLGSYRCHLLDRERLLA